MKVLFFFSGGFDTEHSSTILMTNVLEDCLLSGLIVHYIIPNETGLDRNCPEILKRKKNLSYDVILKKVPKKNQFIRRYIDGVCYAFRSVKYILRQKDVDVIYIQSTPTAFWNILVSKIFGHKKPIIYSVLDMFPGSTIASGVMPQKILQSIFFRIQKVAYRWSYKIMCISEDMKVKLVQQKVNSNKIVPFFTWFDNKSLSFLPDNKNLFIKEAKMDKKNKFYVQYAGNVGYVFDTDMYINIAKRFKMNKKIVFQLVARGIQLEKIKSAIVECGLTNIEILPIQPSARIREVYSACDLEFIPLKEHVIGNSFPSKIAHVMACEKTYLCVINKDTPFAKISKEENIGFCCSHTELDDIVNIITELSSKNLIYNEVCHNAWNYCNKTFTRDVNTEIIIQTIKEVANMNNKRKISSHD